MSLAKKYWNYAKATKGLFSILRNPDNTEAVFEITEGLQDSQPVLRMLNQARSNNDIQTLIAERYLGAIPNLDAFLNLPESSLGHAFATRMRELKLEVVFYPPVTIKDDITYLAMRLRQTHDIWHTITGFDATPVGELGLQAFMLAQLDTPLSVALIGGALLRSLFGGGHPDFKVHALMDSVVKGWQMGVAAKPLLAQRWEDNWSKPLDEWRRDLQITPVS